MKFKTYYHRNANLLVEHDHNFKKDYDELINTINNITDAELIAAFEARKKVRTSTKSLSEPINQILKDKLTFLKWNAESGLFKEPPYNSGNRSRWRLDFAKNNISIEVAFNHQEATAHNIMKPVLASELNHVKKEIQTKLGVIIVATENMKIAGNFDSAIGTFKKFKEYFKPYHNLITTPIVLVGLEPPDSFKINSKTKNIVNIKKT